MRKLYNIFHQFDVDGGFGDAVGKRMHVGLVKATEEEIKNFLEIWDKPRVYEHPYSDLYEHSVVAEEVKVAELKDVVPYDPATRDWPDLPEGMYSGSVYNTETGQWEEI